MKFNAHFVHQIQVINCYSNGKRFNVIVNDMQLEKNDKKYSGWLSGFAEERHWEWLGCHHQSSSQDGQSQTIFVSVLSNNILMARWGWVRGPQRNVVKRCISHYQQSIWKANLTNEQVFESSKRKSKGLLDKLVLAHMAQALMWLEPLKLLLLSSVPPKLLIVEFKDCR